MRKCRSLVVLVFYSVAGLCCAAQAQLSGPTSGNVTVKLIEGLDSAKSQPGTASHAVVIKSTNPVISKNTPAVVQLGVDPASGTLAVQLVQVTVSGQAVKTASSKAVLAGGLIPGLNGGLNKLNNNPISFTGPHVYVPENTVVQFTLSGAGTQAAIQTPQPQRVAPSTPEPANVWQPVKPPFPGITPQAGEGAVSLTALAVNGAKRGRAHIIVSCTAKTNISVHLTIAQALLGYKVDDFNNVNEPGQTAEDAKGRFEFNGTTTPVFLGGNSGDDSPVHLQLAGPVNSLPDSFFTADNKGKAATFTVLPPDGKGTPTVVSFTTPSDSAPLMAVASVCLTGQAAEAAAFKAKIVASCPAKAGKALVDAKVRRTPASKPEFDVEHGEEGGTTWYLTSHPLKAGQHAVLDCIYGVPGAPAPKVPTAANRVSITLPANADNCEVGNDPVTATCSRK